MTTYAHTHPHPHIRLVGFRWTSRTQTNPLSARFSEYRMKGITWPWYYVRVTGAKLERWGWKRLHGKVRVGKVRNKKGEMRQGERQVRLRHGIQVGPV